MKKIMYLYENCKMPLRVAFFGFLLIGFGFLIQNENVNIFYTFSNSFILMLAQGSLILGKALILNLPLIFMMYLVCKKANSGVPVILAILGYLSFLITTSLFSTQNLSTYAYSTSNAINSLISVSGLNKNPLETGLIGSFIVAYITRFSYIRSRHRTSHSLVGFLNKDSAAILYNIVFCSLAGILCAYIFPYIYTFLSSLVTYIAKDLNNYKGIALYGILDRVLSILGLGNFIRYPFWYTALGGTYQTLSGQAVVGDVNIWTYVKDSITTYMGAGRFITPYYVINFFMVPAIYIGFLSSINDHQAKQHYILMVVGASLLSIVCGNPLPLEFLLLFTSPLLLVGYIAVVGGVFGYMSYKSIYLGSSISGDTITAMPGALPDFVINLRNTLYIDTLLQILLVGLVAGVICYIMARVYYRHLSFNLINTVKDEEEVNNVVIALGGYDNLVACGSSLFRINFILKDNELIDVDKLKSLNLARAVETKNGMTIEFGSSSYIISKMIKKTLNELGNKEEINNTDENQ